MLNVTELKKYVTHFSEQLKLEAKYKEDVIVGGKITSITPPMTEEYPLHSMIVDDHVGLLHIYIPPDMFTAYHDSFVQGEYVFVKGIVNVISRQVKGDIQRDYSVIAYDIVPSLKQELEYH